MSNIIIARFNNYTGNNEMIHSIKESQKQFKQTIQVNRIKEVNKMMTINEKFLQHLYTITHTPIEFYQTYRILHQRN